VKIPAPIPGLDDDALIPIHFARQRPKTAFGALFFRHHLHSVRNYTPCRWRIRRHACAGLCPRMPAAQHRKNAKLGSTGFTTAKSAGNSRHSTQHAVAQPVSQRCTTVPQCCTTVPQRSTTALRNAALPTHFALQTILEIFVYSETVFVPS
jgi:hypothetical protein